MATNKFEGFSHIGWVPCVSGHLYFHKASPGLFKSVPGDAVVHYDRHNLRKLIACHSIVYWKDIEGDKNTNGDFRVTLAAEYENRAEELIGTLSITSRRSKYFSEGVMPKSIVEKFAATSTKYIEAHSKKKLDDQKSYNENAASAFNEFKSSQNNTADKHHWKLKFKLTREGFCAVAMDDGYENMTPEESKTLIRQAFYFIKYTWHTHKHHDPIEDSYTSVVSLDSKTDEKLADEMINDLKHSLVSINRNGAQHVDYRSNGVGILSYCSSLVVACEKVGWINSKASEIYQKQFDNTGESIRVQYDDLQRELTKKSQKSDSVRNFLLFALTCIAPSTLIYRQKIAQHIESHTAETDLFLRFNLWVYGTTWGPFLITGVLVISYFVFVFVRSNSDRIGMSKFGKYLLDNLASSPTWQALLKTLLLLLATLGIGALLMARLK